MSASRTAAALQTLGTFGWTVRRRRRRVRRVLRGYFRLRRMGASDRVFALRARVAVEPLGIDPDRASALIFGPEGADADRIVRGFMMKHAGPRLAPPLLAAMGGGPPALLGRAPPAWQDAARQAGFPVARLRSRLAWSGFIAAVFGFGVLEIARIAAASATAVACRHGYSSDRYVHFEQLGPANLPALAGECRRRTIVSWYLQWDGRVAPLDRITHTGAPGPERRSSGVAVHHAGAPLPPLASVGALARFLAWGTAATALSLVDLLRGRWWHPLMLHQAALAVSARLTPAPALAREYLFHHTGVSSRPLWTYEVTRMGSLVSIYFYSTNSEGFARRDGSIPLPWGWAGIDWPRYLAWGDGQAAFLRRAGASENAVVRVGPVWFSDSDASLPELPRPPIAVFDVQPLRVSYFYGLAPEFAYYTAETACCFLRDVLGVAEEHGALLAWKKKRHVGWYRHPRYQRFTARLAEHGPVRVVPPECSAWSLVDASAAVISMPFTSTALIGRELGRPSIYYDATGIIQRDDPAAHGIPVVVGIDELRDWFAGLHLPPLAAPLPREGNGWNPDS
jgi:polysaccharide biosynthesis PFTS motif protein